MDDAAYMRRGAVTLGGYLTDFAFNLGLTRNLTTHACGDFRVAYAFAWFFGLAVLLGSDRPAPMVLAPVSSAGSRARSGSTCASTSAPGCSIVRRWS